MSACGGVGTVRRLAGIGSCRFITVFAARQIRTQETQVQHEDGKQGGGKAAEHIQNNNPRWVDWGRTCYLLKLVPRAFNAALSAVTAFGPIPWSAATSLSRCAVSCEMRVTPMALSARSAGLEKPGGLADGGPVIKSASIAVFAFIAFRAGLVVVFFTVFFAVIDSPQKVRHAHSARAAASVN